MKKVIPLNLNDQIENIPADKGLIHRIKPIHHMDWWAMTAYSLSKNTEHCFTHETPTAFSMKVCIKAHITEITTALNNYPH